MTAPSDLHGLIQRLRDPVFGGRLGLLAGEAADALERLSARTDTGGEGPLYAADNWQALGYKSAADEIEDMANVGRSLMEVLPKGYSYMDSPAEIVTDLQNELDELRTSQGTDTGGEMVPTDAMVEAACLSHYGPGFADWTEPGKTATRNLIRALLAAALAAAPATAGTVDAKPVYTTAGSINETPISLHNAASDTGDVDACDALQAAWGGIASLPPIVFSEAEAEALIAALRSKPQQGER